ncbi:MAG: L,D-transpeptidase family protein [Bacteroidales bacterium]|jgi:L,D-peptidoglycan transpeptidase YkuD (ErfK/YbiS/YcfS/YnhG family)|nr:L,D-transpeptidase family protein [Bacteroidales bacterium]
MKTGYKILTGLVFACLIAGVILTMEKKATAKKQAETALNIIKANKSALDSISQLIVVYNDNPAETAAKLFAFEKKDSCWKVKYGPVKVHLGKDGFAAPGKKREGDEKTPTGLFGLGPLFSYEATVDTGLPFTQVSSDDKWIDDPESDDYNKHVCGRTEARSFERLLLRSDAYKYCLVIDYNTSPVVRGMGSAIFFHLGSEPTGGCIDINEENMKEILSWLTSEKNPHILMGCTKALLYTGKNNS